VRIAVLGVGLIGGSVGLAARRRLGAEVAGWDRDDGVLGRALEAEALDEAADNVADAVAGAEIVVCAAPVSAMPELVDEALKASGPDAVVTDVGSTKRELIAGLPAEEERFIGGHPLAGAETSGVEHARADLFEGARWYLVPTERSGGLHYDRLQRAVAEMGARPQAIEAAAHDELMAMVSHLPHVIANVLVQEAASELASEDERLPEIGPSFRDTTRVAGANPAIWGDIFSANGEAVARAIDSVSERLHKAAELIRAGDRDAVADWHRGARDDRVRLLESEGAGGELRELRVVVQNKPGVVAEIALALGRDGVNIEDMQLYPAQDMSSGAISLWVAGADEAKRAEATVRKLGHNVSVVGGEE
jgi:prephenate dehydrogenase